jgi:anti-sigma factor RsiW
VNPHANASEVPDLPCQEFVALVTDYLEGALDSRQVVIVEAHLASCDGCTSVLAQWREIITLVGRLRPSDVDHADPVARAALLATFRRLRPTPT